MAKDTKFEKSRETTRGAERGMHSVTFQILHMGPWSEGGPPDFSELHLIAHLSYVLFGK